MHQQVHSAGVVPLMLKHNLLPGQAELIGPAVCDVLLPLVGREGGSVQHIVQDVDILDHEGCHGHTEQCRGQVPIQAL